MCQSHKLWLLSKVSLPWPHNLRDVLVSHCEISVLFVGCLGSKRQRLRYLFGIHSNTVPDRLNTPTTD